jgi:hypothetical protein
VASSVGKMTEGALTKFYIQRQHIGLTDLYSNTVNISMRQLEVGTIQPLTALNTL